MACQNFGVMGNEFVELPDGCPIKMPIKSILYEHKNGVSLLLKSSEMSL